MHLASSLLSGTALLAVASAQSFDQIQTWEQQHQLRFDPSAIAYARIDPIMDFGVNTTNGHLHTLLGPNVLNSASTSDQLRTGTCTAFNVGPTMPDMSSYWTPAAYYVHANGSFTLLPMHDGVIYYNMYYNGTIQPFPDDFQMITGNASWLDGGCENGHGNGNGYFYNSTGDFYTLPTTYSATLGIHITFPDCWDGIAFTKETQNEHMFYSTWGEGFNCPKNPTGNTPLIKLPQLVMSFNYETPGTEEEFPANPNGPTYVLATGDQYGCSLHADFMSGWQIGKLQEVIDECSNLGFGNTNTCPLFTMDEAEDQLAFNCQYSELIPDEEIGLIRPIEQLPGCLLVNGVLAEGCDPNVAFVEPEGFDTAYRNAGYPYVLTSSTSIPPSQVTAPAAESTMTSSTPSSTPTTAASSGSSSTVPQWGQCGGEGYTGSTECVAPYTCVAEGAWWSSCQ